MEQSLASGGDFLKASEDTPVMCEETKQTLDFVPRFVACLIIEAWYGTVLCRRNDAGSTLLPSVRHNRIGIIPFVSSKGFVSFMRS